MFSKMPRDFIFWLLENQEVSIKVLVVRGKKLKKIAIKISIENYILPWLFSKQLVAHTSRTLTLQKNLIYLLQRKPFKNAEKCFLFHIKIYFHSQDIQIFVLTFW